MSKSFILGLALGLTILTFIGVGASWGQRRDARDEMARAELAKYQEELVDATRLQLGVATDRQRFHGRLYQYRALTNRTITDLLKHAGGKRLGIDICGQGQVLIEPQTPENYFEELAGASDAAVQGRVINKVSQVTEDDAFIFTDYDLLITEVLKDHSAKPLTIGATIVVTRPGGKIAVNEIVIKASDCGFGELNLGRSVLLFLRYIPETDAYRATRDVGTFEVDGSSMRPLTTSAFPPGVLTSGKTSQEIVRTILTR